MKKVLSLILAVTMLIGILPATVVGATYDATVSTVAGASSVKRGETFTFSVYVEGTFDGFSIDLPKEGSGYTITAGTGTTAAQNGVMKVNCDDKGTYYQVSTMPGWEQTDSDAILVATFTATASEAFKGTPALDVSSCELSDVAGELVSTNVAEGTFTLVCKTHSYADEWAKDDATNHKKACEYCDAKLTEAHDWDEGVIDPDSTHTEKGTKTYTCSVCQETKTEDVPKKPEHNFEYTKLDKDNHTVSCECGHTATEAHHWDEGVVTTPAKCNAFGEKTFTCTDCGETKVQQVPKAAHTYGEWLKHDGAQHKRQCSSCLEFEYKPHAWDDGVVDPLPSCSESGTRTYTCTDCSETKTETVEPTGEHVYGAWEKHNETQHKHSCGCGETEYADHNWNAGVVTTDPTCCDEGVKTFTCTDCGETKTAPVPATNEHVYGAWMKYTPAQHRRLCTNVLCGQYEYANHNWDDGVVTTPPTCTDTGIRTFTCSDCSETKTADEPATGVHTYKVQVNLTLNGVATSATKLLMGKATDTINFTDLRSWANSALTLTGNPTKVDLVGIDAIKPFGEGVPADYEDPCDYTRVDTIDVVTYYNVTYTDGVADNVFADNVTEVKFGNATPTIADPTWAGHVFTGWDKEIAATVTETVTYTATWDADANGNGTPDSEEPKYNVAYFDGVNDAPIFTKDVLVGLATPTIADPVREGYAFMGWDAEIPATVTGNVAFTATWLDVNDAYWTDGNPYYTYEEAIEDVTAGSTFEAPANVSASEALDIIKELNDRLEDLADEDGVAVEALGVLAVITTDDLGLTLDASAVAAIAENAANSDELRITVEEVDEDDARLEDVKLPKDAVLFEIVLTDENGNEIEISNDTNAGTATITLAYAESGSAQICFVNNEGKVTKLRTVTDKDSQTVSATVTEFGLFYVAKSSATISGVIYVNQNYHALVLGGKLVMVPHTDNGTGYCDGCHSEIMPEVED